MTELGMPVGTWEERGGWVCRKLAAEFNLTLEQAAGIVGNLGFESAGFTKLHEIGQPENVGGYGWGQWTASRRVSFMAYARTAKLNWQSDEANYGYLVAELHGAYRHTISELLNCTTVEQAVWSVGQTYERPGGTTSTNLPGYDSRLKYAQRALFGVTALPDDGSEVAAFTGAVEKIQTFLKSKGSYKGAIDGDFGPASRQALADYLKGR